jgi:hypothetical protein
MSDRTLQDFSGLYRTLQDFTGLYRTLHDFTGLTALYSTLKHFARL